METPVPNFYFMGVQFFHLLALAIWVGGTVIIRCIVLPILFHSSLTQTSRDLAQRKIFRRFYNTTLICAGVLLVTSVIKFMTWENLTPWNTIRYLSLIAMICISIYIRYGLSPRIDQASPSESTSLPENIKQSQTTGLNHLLTLADRLMMVALVLGLTAILMA